MRRWPTPPLPGCGRRAAGVEFESEISFAGLHHVLFSVIDHVADLPVGQREALTAALGLGSGSPAGNW